MAVIGYYNMDYNMGADYQANLIAALGQSSLQLTTLGSLGASDVVYLDNGNNAGYNADFLANTSNLLDFVNAGGVLVMHDRFADGSFVAGYTHNSGAPYGADVDFVNDTGRVATGPGGTLTDFSLDGYSSSDHGVADISGWQDSRIFVLATSMDPTKLVAMVQALGEGELIYSTIPTDYWVGTEADPNMTAYMENVLSYAVRLHNMTTVDLTSASETVTGTAGGDKIFAEGGDDVVSGLAGADLLDGGAGRDNIDGGDGDDILWGGADADVLRGSAGNDQLWGQQSRDKLFGGDGHDYMVGGSGNDVLRGEDGDDTVLGGNGNDVIVAGDGYDKISGGAGADTMTGGIAADIFFFGRGDSPTGVAHDVVTDFVHGQDVVDLTEYHVYNWHISTASTFSGVQREVLIYSGGDTVTMVAIDLNGDSHADAIIELRSATAADVADVTDFQFSFPKEGPLVT